MATIKIYQLLGKRIPVTRESAHRMEGVLAAALADDPGEVELDFHGVEGLTPSFLDETLSIIEKLGSGSEHPPLRVSVKHTLTHLSSKFAAVARGHQLTITGSDSEGWIITKERK